jgi:hypothetical protein
VKVLENRFKVVASGSYATKILVDYCSEEKSQRFNLIVATNKGFLKVFDLSSFFKKVRTLFLKMIGVPGSKEH